MRLKTFHAETMAEAIQVVRARLGPDAIIVATAEDSATRGVRITAAVEVDDVDLDFREDETPLGAIDAICQALDDHGTPPRLADRLLNAAAQLQAEAPELALAGALDTLFAFAPLPVQPGDKPLLLFGPPGSGKTVATAKLAARAVLEHRPALLITTDTLRAGAVEQTASYAKRLGFSAQVAAGPDRLATLLQEAGQEPLILIDTTGANPHDAEDLTRLRDFLDVAPAEPVLVMPAGLDIVDAAALADGFRPLAPSRLLVTRLDMVRRLGSALAAADAAKAAFCEIGLSPAIGNGLRPITPVLLARLLLSERDEAASALETISEPIEATDSD